MKAEHKTNAARVLMVLIGGFAAYAVGFTLYDRLGLGGLVATVVVIGGGLFLCVKFSKQLSGLGKFVASVIGVMFCIAVCLGIIYGIVALLHYFWRNS